MNLFHFHEWSKWSDPINSCIPDFRISQARNCKVCGKVEIKRVEQPFNVWYKDTSIIDALKNNRG